MVIDHFNTGVAGGAAIAARRLHAGLLRIGVVSRFRHLRSSANVSKDTTYRVMKWTERPQPAMRRMAAQLIAATQRPVQKHRLRRAFAGRPADAELFSRPFRQRPTPCHPSRLGSDIIHLHWVAHLIDYASFFAAVPDDFPIVWTLHDMNPMTGGCHYTRGCEAFTRTCGHCPQLGMRGADDLSHQFFDTKWNALHGKNLHIVANSRWMESQARSSRLLGQARSFQTIYYCLDTNVFKPYDPTYARFSLGLPNDEMIVAFGAESLDNRRKGFLELLSALPLVKQALPFTAITFGHPIEIPARDATLPQIRSLGFVKDDDTLARIYSAADVFVLPSLEEALGQTGIEAMACGTPVVAFNVGGIPDYVQPMETGLLARVGHSQELANHLTFLLQRPALRKRMGHTARCRAKSQFDLVTQAKKHHELYAQLLEIPDLGGAYG